MLITLTQIQIQFRRNTDCQEEPARGVPSHAGSILCKAMTSKEPWTRADKLNLAALVLGIAGLVIGVLTYLDRFRRKPISPREGVTQVLYENRSSIISVFRDLLLCDQIPVCSHWTIEIRPSRTEASQRDHPDPVLPPICGTCRGEDHHE